MKLLQIYLKCTDKNGWMSRRIRVFQNFVFPIQLKESLENLFANISCHGCRVNIFIRINKDKHINIQWFMTGFRKKSYGC